MSWAIAFRLNTHDFQVLRDPIGGFATKKDACEEVVEVLERERADLSRAIRKAKQMRRRAR